MSQQILSQDEVDALLQGITGENQKLEEGGEVGGGIKEYNLANQERIVRGRMPTMEVINERFARNVRIGLFNLIRRNPEVSIMGTKVHKYGAFLREIVVPTNFNVVGFKPLRGSGLLICEPSLVFATIDALYGGSGKFHARIEGRDFSPTEQRVIMRLVETIGVEFKKSWAGIYPLEIEYSRMPRWTWWLNWVRRGRRWSSCWAFGRAISSSWNWTPSSWPRWTACRCSSVNTASTTGTTPSRWRTCCPARNPSREA